MTSFLSHQDGTLGEAIGYWRMNIDKQFSGKEDCPICLSVIHSVDHSLPRQRCRTCGKVFHAACLYKWFQSSKATCPMCRSMW